MIINKMPPDKVKKVRKLYEEDENRQISRVSAEIENEFYLKYTRVEETVEFAKRMGFGKIGIATCVGLIDESMVLSEILKKNGFEVSMAACKICGFRKSDVGVGEEYMTNTSEIMCNPIMQAEALNEAGTEFNIVMGLCVGHDSLFYKYSKVPVTTLVAKDRVLAHNPAGAIYQAKSYYKKLMK
ncbi:MAG: DUF1847 domain-containing protein [Firmicutes bacterium]|nr:DUF1847 domain-containing protein [Bacillota bacterium]